MARLDDIPVEVLVAICTDVDFKTYISLRRACSRWRQVCGIRAVELHQLNNLHRDYYVSQKSKQVFIDERPTSKESLWINSDNFHVFLRMFLVGLDIYPKHRILTGSMDQRMAYSGDGTRLAALSYTRISPDTGKLLFCIYDLSHDTPKLLLRQESDTDSQPDLIEFSADNDYLGLAYNGHIKLYKISETTAETPLGPLVFSHQYPSKAQSMSVSSGGEVLFIRFSRLGGLILVNSQTEEEIDVGHYRLDLRMNALRGAHVLAVHSNIDETLIFGRSRTFDGKVDSTVSPHTLWNYFKFLLEAEMSVYIPIRSAIPVGGKWFFGLRIDNSKGPTLYRAVDYRLPTYEAFAGGAPDDDYDASSDESDDDDDDENEEADEDGGDEQEEIEDDDQDNSRLRKPKFLRLVSDSSEIVARSTDRNYEWCASVDGTRLAMVLGSEYLAVYSLNTDMLEELRNISLQAMPCRYIHLEDQKNPVQHMQFINRDRILVQQLSITTIYELACDKQQCTYSRLQPNGEVSHLVES